MKQTVPSEDQILAFLRRWGDRPLSARELSRRLRVRPEAYPAFRRRLRQLERRGLLYKQRKGGYGLPERFSVVVGRLEVTRGGAGFVIPEEPGEADVFVPGRLLSSAVEGDRVVVRVERRRRGRNPQGSVVRVLDRAWTQVVGTYHASRGYGTVRPVEPRLRAEIHVPSSLAGAAVDGSLVLVEIRDWGRDELRPVGEVTRHLGHRGDPGAIVLSIVLGHQLPVSFPADALQEAARLVKVGLRPGDLVGREDFRDRLAFTIDPEDARDHDDALSIHDLGAGRLEIGVHIADVSFYVKRGGALDRAARERATSVYLPDRALPMLPEELSGDLCSLVPGQDRLTLSVIFRSDGSGTRMDPSIVRGVIRSRFRLSYEDAQSRLDRADSGGTPSAGQSDVTDALLRLREVSRALRQRREQAGAIDFAIPEVRVLLDDEGRPTAIRPRPRLETHRIVEDFMVHANETIADLASREGLAVLYRIHEEPDEDKIAELRETVESFGHALPRRRVRPLDISDLLRRVEGEPYFTLVSTLALRCMRQARYSPRNVGHFGLASKAYAHFTSPIRRYPDLVTHREVARWIQGRPARGRARGPDEELARHASEQERRAEAAERDATDALRIEYMRRHLGDVFTGTVSGVASYGAFVLLDGCLAEGLLRVSSLSDDYYRYDAGKHSLVGRRSRRRIRLGDRLKVQVARVDPDLRSIELELSGPLDHGERGH